MTKMENLTEESNSASQLMHEIQQLIEQSRSSVAVTVNAGLTMLYWQIGRRINQELLQDRRADYGQRVLHTLSAKLTVDYGQGFSEKNLRRMIQFSQVFIDEKIVVSAIRQLSWTHFLERFLLELGTDFTFIARQKRIQIDSDDFYIDLLFYHRNLRRLVCNASCTKRSSNPDCWRRTEQETLMGRRQN